MGNGTHRKARTHIPPGAGQGLALPELLCLLSCPSYPAPLSLGALCPHKGGHRWGSFKSIRGWLGHPPLEFLATPSLSVTSYSCQHESGPHWGTGRGHVWSRVRPGLWWAPDWAWGRVVDIRLFPLFGQPGFLEAEGWQFPPLCPPEHPHQPHALTLPGLPGPRGIE